MTHKKTKAVKRKTLLQVAKAVSARVQPSYKLTRQDVTLALAWARGEIETYQVAVAKEFPKANSHSYVYKYISECFARYVQTQDKGGETP